MKAIYLIGSSVFIILALCFFIGSFSFESPGAETFPQVSSLSVLLLSVIFAVKNVRKHETLQGEFKETRPKAVLYTILTTIGYLFLILGVGFFIATPVYLFVLMLILGMKEKHLLIAVPVGATIIIYLAFVLIFHVPVPTGVLFGN
jgi:hypothetical protein